MKKALSVFLALCVMLMTSITAFAAEAPSSDKVWEQIEGAAAYLTDGVESYSVDSAVDFCIITASGADVSKYADSFIQDVKANLEANDGKIVSSSYGENLATYGAVIVALLDLGEDTTDFYGYNIEEAFMAMDPTVALSTPNYYRIIARAAFYCDDSDDFLEAICDAYIDGYYTMGKGADYYGYSCDNTAYFIDAVTYGRYALDKYEDVLNDAIAVLDTYKVDGGYCFNPEYGAQPNADSTALALMAHCAYAAELVQLDDIDDEDAYLEALNNYFETVNAIYADLCAFEGSSTGVFTYQNDEDSAYATQEALIALSYYYRDAVDQELASDDGGEEETAAAVAQTATAAATTTTAAATTTKADTSTTSPNTGSDAAAVSVLFALCAAVGALAALKKKKDDFNYSQRVEKDPK